MPTKLFVDDVYKAKWMKATELPDHDLILTISDVSDELIGPDKELKFIVSFQELEQGLILNKTNSLVLQERFGKDPNQWVGRKILIYATEVNFAGKTTLAIRIRLKEPAQTQPATSQTPILQPPALPSPSEKIPW